MTNVQALARDWLDAKRAETLATEKRHAIEKELAAALDVPQEGSKTHKIEGYKITLTQPVTRRLMADEWDKVRDLCPSDLKPIKVKVEPDATGCKWLADNEPEIWRKIASAFETKPGRVVVKVEETK